MPDVFSDPPVLRTERLVLRQITESDGEGLFGIFADDQVTEFYAWDRFTDVGQGHELAARTAGKFRQREAIRWGLVLARDYWRRGLMSEAVAAVRHRGSALATTAALIGGLGAFCGAITNVMVYPNLAAAATAHMSPGAAAQFLVTTFNSGFGHAFTYAYFLGIYAGPVLMGIALWRSRSVPRWLAVLFFAGLEVAQQMSSAGIIVVVFMLPFAAAMILLAAWIWRASPAPASSPNLKPSGAAGEQLTELVR